MNKRLNQWQIFWVLFSGVLLMSTVVLIVSIWPTREPGIVADLRSPECQVWREVPEGVFPDERPESGEQCYVLRSFLYDQQVTVRSEGEYDRYLAAAGTKTAVTCLASWAGFSAGIYLLGLGSRWVSRALRKLRDRKDT